MKRDSPIKMCDKMAARRVSRTRITLSARSGKMEDENFKFVADMT